MNSLLQNETMKGFMKVSGSTCNDLKIEDEKKPVAATSSPYSDGSLQLPRTAIFTVWSPLFIGVLFMASFALSQEAEARQISPVHQVRETRRHENLQRASVKKQPTNSLHLSENLTSDALITDSMPAESTRRPHLSHISAGKSPKKPEVRSKSVSGSIQGWVDRYLWTPLSGIFLGFIVTVLGALAYDRLKRRVSIKIVHRNTRNVVDEVHSLYLHRIDPADRVAPNYVTHFLSSPQLCIKSVRHFRSLARRSTVRPVMHLLIAAKCQGEVVGLLKAIYVHSVRMLFIAYAAVQSGDSSLERRSMSKILSQLQRLTNPLSPVEWIAFELTTSDKNLARAKDRLFRQHAKTFGIDLKRVDIEYLQPDLDCAQIADCHEEPASLYVGSTRGSYKHLDLAKLREILDAILLDIYLPTWLIDHDPQEAPALQTYVLGLAELILQKSPQKVALL